MDNSEDRTFESANRVYSRGGLCPTIPTCAGGGIQPKVIAAMRGRGERNEQTLEVNGSGSANALTTVQKDNLVLERNMAESERQSRIKAKKMPNGNIRFFQDDERKSAVSELQLQNPENEAQTITAAGYAKIYEKKPFVVDAYNKRRIDGNVCGTLTAHGNTSSTHCGTFLLKEDKEPPFAGLENASESRKEREYRIRKLTPRECFRLMGVKDCDADKALAANSATQCYKQAGNSIVVPVLEALFLQMGIQGKNRWNEMTDEERRPFWDFLK